MNRDAALPIEFVALTGKVQYIARVGKNEYSSSCPECGGGMHEDGRTYPDRFKLFVVGKYGAPLGWCRKCGYVWTALKEHKPTREEIQAWRMEQIKIETERKAAAERALELLQNEHLWEKFYQDMTNNSRQIGRSWGISESMQDYVKMGFIPDYRVYKGENSPAYRSPAITFPVWWAGDKVQNIKLRILEPHDSNDRYRNWYRTGEHYFYMPLHDVEFSPQGIILVEGEKKAIVVEQNNHTSLRVIGMQSVKPDPDLFALIADCEPVYIVPDPDAFLKPHNGGERGVDYLLRNVGKERARIVRVPVKVDDGIVLHNLDLGKYLRMATKG